MIAANWSRENIAWAAGLFEGEGCIRTTPETAQLSLAMSDEDVVRRFLAVIGIGAVYGPTVDKRKPTYKPMWKWCVGGSAKVQAVLAALWAFLGERRKKKAELAIAQIALRAPHGKYKVRCKRGHELLGDNVYLFRGHRCCRECRRVAARGQRRKRGYYERMA